MRQYDYYQRVMNGMHCMRQATKTSCPDALFLRHSVMSHFSHTT